MTIWLVFALAAVGTYAIRLSGIAILGDEERVPPLVRRALRMIGPAAMGAIVGNSLVLEDGAWRPLGAWHLAALAALAVGVWRRSLGWTMLAGAGAFTVLLALGL